MATCNMDNGPGEYGLGISAFGSANYPDGIQCQPDMTTADRCPYVERVDKKDALLLLLLRLLLLLFLLCAATAVPARTPTPSPTPTTTTTTN